MEGLNVNPLGLDFSISALASGFIFGVIGLYVFRHAKKTLNYPQLFVSIALMSYTLFTHGPWQDWGVGFVLCGAAYYFEKNANLTG